MLLENCMNSNLLAIVSFLPSIIPLFKMYKRTSIDVFDLLIFFHGLYFCIIPLITGGFLAGVDSISIDVYVYYNSFVYTLILLKFTFLKYFLSGNSVLNISDYLMNLVKVIKFNRFSTSVFFLFLAICWYDYSVTTSHNLLYINLDYYDMRSEVSLNTSYAVGVIHILVKSILQFAILALCVRAISRVYNNIKISAGDFVLYLGYFTLLVLGSRTLVIGSFFVLIFIVYSVFRNKISLLDFIKFVVIGVLLVVFTFAINSVYRSALRTISKNIDGRIGLDVYVLIASEAFESLVGNDDKLVNSTAVSSRANSLYNSLSQPFVQNQTSTSSSLFLESVSISIPKVIYPQKSKLGSQGIIEAELGAYNDIGDSLLLFWRMEMGLLGGVACAFYYVFLFLIWNLLVQSFQKYLPTSLVFIPLAIIFGLCQYVEVTNDTIVAAIFQFVPITIGLHILTELFRSIRRNNVAYVKILDRD